MTMTMKKKKGKKSENHHAQLHKTSSKTKTISSPYLVLRVVLFDV